MRPDTAPNAPPAPAARVVNESDTWVDWLAYAALLSLALASALCM